MVSEGGGGGAKISPPSPAAGCYYILEFFLPSFLLGKKFSSSGNGREEEGLSLSIRIPSAFDLDVRKKDLLALHQIRLNIRARGNQSGEKGPIKRRGREDLMRQYTFTCFSFERADWLAGRSKREGLPLPSSYTPGGERRRNGKYTPTTKRFFPSPFLLPPPQGGSSNVGEEEM